MLVDAGAKDFTLNDPKASDIAHSPPSISFRVTDGNSYCLTHSQAIAEHNKQQLPIDMLDKIYTCDTFKIKQLLNQLVPAMAELDPCLRLFTNRHRLNEAGDLACVEKPIEE